MKYILFLQLLFYIGANNLFAQSESLFPEPYTVFKIKLSDTDTEITDADTPHFLVYGNSIKHGKLLLFMPGTNGIALRGPKNLFLTVTKQGYRVINLSYINTPAVARICKGETLNRNSNCAEKFRTKCIFGTGNFSLIDDQPQDAIVNRLTKLLIYLNENDKDGNWDEYLDDGNLKWEESAVYAQSQGGPIAAFIAKSKLVPRVISFSGGWAYTNSETKEIASWYYKESITPYTRYYGTYHTTEPAAKIIDSTYKAMRFSEEHI
ncbi:hypothetical protein JBL43_05375 [Aureibaculum sp. A20]|uniref:Alpha/beta hydrolase n=1 Tax=Aureibaculum flavum TaxID=2795986 RepID=A0ABS0WP69_9FLAO|nr:hypothetical protein [Aureibaculum flavum]MBJ2173658.1 hypothetical protein [Aureibaculum flavum]